MADTRQDRELTEEPIHVEHEYRHTWFEIEGRFIPLIDEGDDLPTEEHYQESEALTKLVTADTKARRG